MKFSIKDFFSKCEQILNGKLYYLRSVALPDFNIKVVFVGDFEQVLTNRLGQLDKLTAKSRMKALEQRHQRTPKKHQQTSPDFFLFSFKK